MGKSINKVLLTGASGFIGSHTCKNLLNSGYRVRRLIRKHQSLDLIPQSNLENVIGDLQNAASLHAACDSVDIVVHIAGIAHTNNISSEKLFDLNTFGTESLLAAAVAQRVKTFIFVSSTLAETLDTDGGPTTTYGESKSRAEKLLFAAHQAGSIKVLVLRPVNVYGPGMRGSISTLIALISRNRIPLLPLLKTRISLIGVNDVAQAIKLAVENSTADGKAYVLTDGQVYTINNLEKEIYKALGKEMPTWRCPRFALYLGLFFARIFAKFLNMIGLHIPTISGVSSRTYSNLITDNVFDNSEACIILGFQPRETFYSSLVEWVDSSECDGP